MSKDTAVGDPPVHHAVDLHVLEALERLGDASGEDLIGELGTMFEADAGNQLIEMHRALDHADALAVSRSAHNLSGASASLGATDLASLCNTLETESAGGNLSNGETLLEAVESELELVNSEFATRSACTRLARARARGPRAS